MIQLNQTLRIPLFNNALMKVVAVDSSITFFSLQFEEGPYTGIMLGLKVTGREQDRVHTVAKRFKVKIIEGPPSMVGIERWIDAKDFIG